MTSGRARVCWHLPGGQVHDLDLDPGGSLDMCQSYVVRTLISAADHRAPARPPRLTRATVSYCTSNDTYRQVSTDTWKRADTDRMRACDMCSRSISNVGETAWVLGVQEAKGHQAVSRVTSYETSLTLKYVVLCWFAAWLGPFYGAIAVPSVTRCRCRRWCCCGHRCSGGVRQ